MDGIEQHLIAMDAMRQKVADLEARNTAAQIAYLEVRNRELQNDKRFRQLAAITRGLVKYIESLPQPLKPHRQNRPPLANWDQ